MSILNLEPNKPYQIALKYKGKEAKSHYEGKPQFQFTLTDGSILYLPVEVADSITALHLGPQEPFILTKQSQTNTITWSVERVPQPGPKLVEPAKTKTELMNDLGHVLAGTVPPTPPVIPETPVKKGPNKFYLDRACALIDVFAAAHKHAVKHYDGAVSKEDVRALVTTVFIQCTPKPGPERSGTGY